MSSHLQDVSSLQNLSLTTKQSKHVSLQERKSSGSVRTMTNSGGYFFSLSRMMDGVPCILSTKAMDCIIKKCTTHRIDYCVYFTQRKTQNLMLYTIHFHGKSLVPRWGISPLQSNTWECVRACLTWERDRRTLLAKKIGEITAEESLGAKPRENKNTRTNIPTGVDWRPE